MVEGDLDLGGNLVAEGAILSRAIAPEKIAARLLPKPVGMVPALKVIVTERAAIGLAAAGGVVDEAAHMGLVEVDVEPPAIEMDGMVAHALCRVGIGDAEVVVGAGVDLEVAGEVEGGVLGLVVMGGIESGREGGGDGGGMDRGESGGKGELIRVGEMGAADGGECGAVVMRGGEQTRGEDGGGVK